MRGYFVTFSGNCSHDFRPVSAQPTKNEECAPNAVPIEARE
jgi:hypothetical protein